MSYNITSWRTKSIYLELPIDFDFQNWLRGLPDRDNKGIENVGKRWLLEEFEEQRLTTTSVALATNTWKIVMCNQGISGIIEDGKRIVTSLDDWYGECSGVMYIDILLPLFRDFKGNLEALVIWEGGDSLTMLRIDYGCIEEINAE